MVYLVVKINLPFFGKHDRKNKVVAWVYSIHFYLLCNPSVHKCDELPVTQQLHNIPPLCSLCVGHSVECGVTIQIFLGHYPSQGHWSFPYKFKHGVAALLTPTWIWP